MFANRSAMSRLFRGLGLTLAALAVLGWGHGTARAGQLDRELLRKSGAVLYYLDARGYRNVGVLPFLVQRGSRPASYEETPLALNLPIRLENSLIIGQDPAGRTIGIIRNAVGTANQGRVGPYRRSATALRRLFALKYDLAWSGKTVRADAFLTGTVLNAGTDRARTQVVIHAFDARSLKAGKPLLEKVCAFEVPTDEPLLADLGYSYALPRAVLQGGVTANDRRRLALSLVARRDGKGLPPIQAGEAEPMEAKPGDIGGFAFDILYDGEKQKITPLATGEGQRTPTFQVPTAPEGTDVTLVLTRKDAGEETLGVVLKVNGQSVWDREDSEAERCRKWVYAPSRKEADEFKGFYTGLKGKNLLKFRALTAEESALKASELGNRVGWIDVTVFGPAKQKAPVQPEIEISTRSVRRVNSRTGLREVRMALMRANGVRMKPVRLGLVRKKEVIDAEVSPTEGPTIETGKLVNPTRIGHASIRYWLADPAEE